MLRSYHAIRVAVALIIFAVPFLISAAPSEVRKHAPQTVNYDAVKDAVILLINKEMKKHDVIGLSIALVDDQQIVWAQGFGFADEKNNIPAGPDTVYRIGSLTRLFTATAIMQFVEQGKLDINAPLHSYVPEFSIRSRFANARQITLRDLLTHHSGLPSNYQKGMWSRTPEPFMNVLKLIKEEYAAYPPGLMYSDSNIGYALLGTVVQMTSGQDFAAYLHDALLRPLNMAHSGISPAPAKGYYKGKEVEEPFSRDISAGGLSSTVSDLGRFMQMIIAQGKFGNEQILRPETLKEMLQPQKTTALDLGMHAGIGWMLSGLGEIDIQNAGIVAHHAGATLFSHSQMIILPAHKLGVVVLSNSSPSARVVNKAAVEAITRALEAKTGIKQPEQVKFVEKEIPLSPETQKTFEGFYATSFGVVNITRDSDHLNAEVMNKTLRLVPVGEGQFGLRYKFLGLVSINLGELESYPVSRRTVAGREILLVSGRGREMLIGEKIKPMTISEAWKNRAGEYVIDNPGNDYPLIEKVRFRFDNGLLIGEYLIPLFADGWFGFALEPVSDTEAIMYGLGRGMGETIKVVVRDGKELLNYSGYVLRKKQD